MSLKNRFLLMVPFLLIGLGLLNFLPEESPIREWVSIITISCYWITYFIIWCIQAKRKENVNQL